jgi:hypothetical protein
MLSGRFGKIVSYGERICKTYNFPQMIVFQIEQNGPPLEVVFNKQTLEVVEAKFIHHLLYRDGVGTGLPQLRTNTGEQLG